MNYNNISVRAGIFVSIVMASSAAIIFKGPNLDEFWTLVFTDPSLDYGGALKLWMHDTTHPIGYYFFVRLWLEVFPVSVESVRIVNIVIWCAFIYYLLFSAVNRSIRTYCVIFALSISATYHCLERLAEARAYFPAFALVCLLLVSLKGLESEEKSGHRHLTILAGSVVLALLDYPIFAAGAALLFVAAFFLLVSGRRTDAIRVILAMGAGVVTMAASMLSTMHLEQIAPAYHSTTMGYFRSVAIVLVSAAIGNAIVTALALNSMASFQMKHFLRDRGLKTFDFKLVALFSTAAVVIAFLIVNVLTHIIITRHVVSLVALACATLAAWLPERVAIGRMAWLVLAAYALTTGIVLYRLSKMEQLNHFSSLLASERAKCRDFKIIPVDMYELGERPKSVLWASRADASFLGQTMIAKAAGFPLASPGVRRVDDRCGGAVWFMPGWIPATPEWVIDKIGLNVDQKQREGARVYREESMMLLLIPGTHD